MKLAKSLTAITLLALSGLAAAQSNPPVFTPQERAELHRDNREIAADRHELRRDKYDLRQDRRAGDAPAIRADRREVNQDHYALHTDRVDRHRDVVSAVR